MEVLLGISLALSGVMAGIYISTLISDRRIDDLSAPQYTAMHQMRDKTFRWVMPPLALAAFGLALASTVLALAPGWPCLLGAAATLLMAMDIALTLARQLPLNRQIQKWTDATIPSDWTRIRERWTLHHNVRSLLGVAAYVCLLVAVLLTFGRMR